MESDQRGMKEEGQSSKEMMGSLLTDSDKKIFELVGSPADQPNSLLQHMSEQTNNFITEGKARRGSMFECRGIMKNAALQDVRRANSECSSPVLMDGESREVNFTDILGLACNQSSDRHQSSLTGQPSLLRPKQWMQDVAGLDDFQAIRDSLDEDLSPVSNADMLLRRMIEVGIL